MAKRPPLSEQSFLAHLFGPKRSPLPTGLRKRHLSGLSGDRKKVRLAAFNRMSPFSQELLSRAGLRDAYLRGEAKLSEAKAKLRPRGIVLGVAKPVRHRTLGVIIRTNHDALVARHLKTELAAEHKWYNSQHIDENVTLIPTAGADYDETLRWGYSDIKYAGREGSEYEVFVDGALRNPFWYH